MGAETRDPANPTMTRRALIGAGVAGGAALVAGGLPSLWAPPAAAGTASEPWIEASIPELQRMMASGQLTSRSLTLGYLNRIDSLNPLLGAVIETNQHALATAAQRDEERRVGRLRGPLHGIPILLKDNIATTDPMQTTAGSLALVGSKVPRDAPIVKRLRDAGAVILGKANLSEWANFRGFAPFNGWSARGGFTREPYVLDFDPCGSSSGSAVAPAANLCAAAVGTETDGSIVCPAGNNLVFGLKPTLGELPQAGIIPIAHSQDTAGPMARTVVDVSILFDVMRGHPGDVDASHWTTSRHGLRGVRIGVDRQMFEPPLAPDDGLVAVAGQGIAALQSLGATVVETDTGSPLDYFDAEFTVLLVEFKHDVAAYLGTLQNTSMRTLADLIAFNQAHCPEEMKYFGQELFELAESTSGDLSDPDYIAARKLCLRLARDEGIDAALKRDHLDAIVAPTYSFGSTPPAVAGYPNVSIPVGLTSDGRPGGLWMYGGRKRDRTLLHYAGELERELQPRREPQFMGSVPPEPADAGICAAPLTLARRVSAAASGAAPIRPTHHLGTGRALPH